VVGGLVRDLVLGRYDELIEPDVVVVGDGIRFARALAEALGGTVEAESEFGTARVSLGNGDVDVVTARSETYPEPGALPQVTPAGISEDLARRDFAVNAMAVVLTPSEWGQLLDPQNGFSDAARRRIRVMHDKSFQDDPTRMLRAVRYLVRLHFSLDLHTSELLERDLHYLDRISSARLRSELVKLLKERERADMLRKADQLHILGAIEPSFRLSRPAIEAMEKAGDDAGLLKYLAYATAALTGNEADAVIKRLDPPNDWREIITAASRYHDIANILDQEDLTPSEVVELLEPFPVEVLEVQQELAPSLPRKVRLRDYLHKYQHIKSELNGRDLLEAGVPEGPAVGVLLEDLKRARLDGRVGSKEEELAFVKRRLPSVLPNV
jgi:tRNA nucleotidyltransferase (CCA-adding enzyme)